ncbi:MAG: DNA gyrase inhibitor YacG [Bradyrhizobium sp.]
MPSEPPKGAAPGKAGAKKCPICGKPAVEASKPFCSERCRDVDLNRWLSGSYVVPGKPEADEDAE